MGSKSKKGTSWLSFTITHGKWYLVSSILTKGIGFFLLPIYTNYLSTEDYGVLNNINAISEFLAIFISLYIDTAFIRFYHEVKNNPGNLKKLFSSVYWFIVLYGGAICFFAILSSFFWANSFLNINVFPLIPIAFVATLLTQLNRLGEVYLKQELSSKRASTLGLVSFGLVSSITVVLLVKFNMGVLARFIGSLTACLFLFVYYFRHFRSKGLLVYTISFKEVKRCLVFSIPMIPNIAGGWISSVADRLLITYFDDLSGTGIYSLAFQFAYLLYIFQDALYQVYAPLSLDSLINGGKNARTKIENYSLVMWSFVMIGFYFLSVLSQEIVYIATHKDFHSAYKIIPILAFTYVISSIYRIFISVISYVKKMWIISSGGIINGAVNVALNVIFIPKYGAIGAAYATVVSTLMYMLWIVIWSQYYFKLNINIPKVAMIFGLPSIIIYYFLSTPLSWEFTVIKILTGSLLAGLFYIVVVKPGYSNK